MEDKSGQLQKLEEGRLLDHDGQAPAAPKAKTNLTCQSVTLDALSVLDSLVVGSALGYGTYTVIAIKPNARGPWAYHLLWIFGGINGAFEVGRIVSCASKPQTDRFIRHYEAHRDAYGNSLASAGLIAMGISDSTAQIATTCAATAAFTAGQIVNRIWARRREVSEQPLTVAQQRCGVFNDALKAVYGALDGAGLSFNAMTVIEGFDVKVPLAAKVTCPIVTGLVNVPAQYGYSKPAKLIRHGVSGLNNGWYLTTIFLDLIEDATRSDLSGGWKLALPIIGAIVIGGPVTIKRYLRDVSPADELKEFELFDAGDNPEQELFNALYQTDTRHLEGGPRNDLF